MTHRILFGVVGAVIFVTAIQGHHSISGVYDTSRSITIEGTVTQFQFINPHPFVTMTAETRNDGKQQWRLELDNRFELVEIGMNERTIKPGDRIAVSGNPGRNQATSLYVLRLDRPADGLRYEQIGFTPRIAFPDKR